MHFAKIHPIQLQLLLGVFWDPLHPQNVGNDLSIVYQFLRAKPLGGWPWNTVEGKCLTFLISVHYIITFLLWCIADSSQNCVSIYYEKIKLSHVFSRVNQFFTATMTLKIAQIQLEKIGFFWNNQSQTVSTSSSYSTDDEDIQMNTCIVSIHKISPKATYLPTLALHINNILNNSRTLHVQ